MGNKKSKIIEVDNIQEHLSRCEDLGKRSCSVYGDVHFVRYNNMEFLLGEAQTTNQPSPGSLHYLVPPSLLVIPEFTLLEDSKPQTVDDLVQILVGVSELCRDCEVGVGRGRIAFAGKWGVVGQKPAEWGYQQVLRDSSTKGVYLSPELIMNLSQKKMYPKHNPQKSNVYALGIMALQIIFQQDLSELFQYKTFEINVSALVSKLSKVKTHFGESLSNIMVRMLEIEDEERPCFDQLLEMITAAQNSGPRTNRRGSTMVEPSNIEYSGVRTPTKKCSPARKKNSVVIGQKNCSPHKVGCFMDNVRTPQRLGRTGRTPERVSYKQTKVSPLKRDLRINTRFDKQNTVGNGYNNGKSPAMKRPTVSPLSRR